MIGDRPDVARVACPDCGVLAGYCLNRRGRPQGFSHRSRIARARIAREMAQSIIPPKRGGIYWCPDDKVPPPITMVDGWECRHNVSPVTRMCECGCVRLPPVAFHVAVMAYAPDWRQVEGENDHGPVSYTEKRPAVVLSVSGPEAATDHVPGRGERSDWSDWDCASFGLPDPDGVGLFEWSGTLTVGWDDDGLEGYVDGPPSIDFRWDGEWRQIDIPDRSR